MQEQKGWTSSLSPDRQGRRELGLDPGGQAEGCCTACRPEGQPDGAGLPPDLLCGLGEAASLSGTRPAPGTIRDSDPGPWGEQWSP